MSNDCDNVVESETAEGPMVVADVWPMGPGECCNKGVKVDSCRHADCNAFCLQHCDNGKGGCCKTTTSCHCKC